MIQCCWTYDSIPLQCLVDQLDQILDEDLSFQPRRFDGITEHHQVFWTGRHQHGHAWHSSRFTYSTFSGSLFNFGLFLHPDFSAARAATKRPIAVTRHLDQLTAECAYDAARRIVNPVITSQITRVMISNFIIQLP